MIGPNGAGKSTVFNLITGIYQPTHGSIDFDGRSICGVCAPSAIAACGIARTFQNIRLFAFMSVLDNVMTGEHARMHANLVDSLLHTPGQRAEERRVRGRARRTACASSGSTDANDEYARNLPYGMPAPARDRARACDGTEALAARRAGSRDESAREGRPDRADPPHPRHAA